MKNAICSCRRRHLLGGLAAVAALGALGGLAGCGDKGASAQALAPVEIDR